MSTFTGVFLIFRPAEVHIIPDEYVSPQSAPSNGTSLDDTGQNKDPLERAPHSVDLDITLEDKAKVQDSMWDY